MASPIRPEAMGVPLGEKSEIDELNRVRLEREKADIEQQLSKMDVLSAQGGEKPDQEAVGELHKKLAEIEEELKQYPKAQATAAGK